jgi:hypothetical protein
MLLFDLEDYTGLLDTCPSTEDWEDIATTARATRDAFFKALNQWYLASTVCLVKSNPCYDAIKKQWDIVFGMMATERQGGNGTINNIMDEFFSHLIDENKIFTDELCNRYRKIMLDFRCAIKRLMRLVDGDVLQEPKWDYFYNRS